MKKLITLSLLLLLFLSCDKTEPLPPNTYEINVTAKGTYNGVRAYIKTLGNSRSAIAIDTAIIADETFTFKGTITNPKLCNITINSISGVLPIILEPGRTTIEIFKDSIQYSKVDGSENTTAFNDYNTKLRNKTDALNVIRTKMNTARIDNKPEEYKTYYEESQVLNKAIKNYPLEFVQSHKKTDYSLLLLESILKNNNQVSIEDIKKSMIYLTDIINKNDHNKDINKRLNIYLNKKIQEDNLNIGRIAPDFSGTTPEGKTISLNDIKGKVTIVDFWAAWCGPCRRENPNVVKVYEKFHDKGLEIISVSLDGRNGQRNPKEAWVKAIDNDKLNWHHVSSLTYFNEPAAKLYNINAIPATFILDEDGVIVSKRLRGIALENKIAELLN